MANQKAPTTKETGVSQEKNVSPSKLFTIPKRTIRRAATFDQASSASPSPEKNGDGVLDERPASEFERPYGITRFKSPSQKVPSVVRKKSDPSLHTTQNTPPKTSSSTPGDSRLTPKQSRLTKDLPDRRQPSPLQRHKHSISQPILPLSGSSQGTQSDGGLSRSGNLTESSQEQLRDALADLEDEEHQEEESASSAILHLLFMLSRNPECHSELLAHLALPSNADRLVAMAHASSTSVEDLSKIALLLHNMFEVSCDESWLCVNHKLIVCKSQYRKLKNELKWSVLRYQIH